MYDYYESSIVNFASIEEFDALIVALDTYDTPVLREKLIEALHKRAKCPVISFREDNESFYSVTTEANDAVKKMVQHFTEEHHVKRFGFMAGYHGHVDSEVRFQSFLKELARLDLTLEKNAVYHGDMWKLKGEEAYRFFFEGDGIRPEGIICANDFMARALCKALQSHGIRVPEDVCIGGFDNVRESYNMEPGLTTVAVDYETMAKEAVRLVSRLLKNERTDRCVRVPALIILRESCCKKNKDEDIKTEELHYGQQMDTFAERHNRQMYFSIDMDGCTSYEEMYHIIENNLELLGEYKDFYLCFFEQRDEDGVLVFDSGISKQASLKLAYHNGNKIPLKDITFEQKELLPSEFVSKDPFVCHFTLLHNRSKCFGYTAVSYKNPAAVFDSFFHNWNLTLSLAINELSAREKLLSLSKKNEENSITDYLTGLLNRRGFEKKAFAEWNTWVEKNESVLFISMDLDRLKHINDTFGHKEGDRAIGAVANAIRLAIEGKGFAARTGGDEFEVLIAPAKEEEYQKFLKDVTEFLKQENERDERYRIGVSSGYFCKVLEASDDYEECIRISDAAMYRNKISSRK